jgi:hypothetical protein
LKIFWILVPSLFGKLYGGRDIHIGRYGASQKFFIPTTGRIGHSAQLLHAKTLLPYNSKSYTLQAIPQRRNAVGSIVVNVNSQLAIAN